MLRQLGKPASSHTIWETLQQNGVSNVRSKTHLKHYIINDLVQLKRIRRIWNREDGRKGRHQYFITKVGGDALKRFEEREAAGWVAPAHWVWRRKSDIDLQ